MNIPKKHMLFVCMANVNRSKTGELLYAENYETKSAGFEATTKDAKQLTEDMINWSDIIIVFEDEHVSRLQKEYSYILGSKIIIDIDIPDIHRFNSESLRDRINDKLDYCLRMLEKNPKSIIKYHELERYEK